MVNILFVIVLLNLGPVLCDTSATLAPLLSHDEVHGFPFEMIMTRLQQLEHHIIEKDLQSDARITSLVSAVDNLVVSVDRLNWVAQQSARTINELGFNGKVIAQNLTALQRDVRDLLARQQTLITRQELSQLALQGRCNATFDGPRGKYTSCKTLPFRSSGVYQIHPEKSFKEPMTVLCDQEYDSGGWVVIQHRFDGSTNFYRDWKEYKNGFGDLEGEFWLGLDRIHQLTSSKPHELVILLEDFEGNKTFAKYDLFEIGGESQQYTLDKISGYTGTAADGLTTQVGMKFTTLDADNDTWGKNCAVEFTGAWWYTACHSSNLNGQYLRGETKLYAKGMTWSPFRGQYYSLKTSKMMIRPTDQ
ncbi:ficolin-2-like [Anopheles aquasalis]|uniref:ficolin-2-like n=1 Tax=Anopheles aquasalis TaxID=42839 RepID=UPI00215B465E|nr:ficolin-2-like [Anopheles aquasalis]